MHDYNSIGQNTHTRYYGTATRDEREKEGNTFGRNKKYEVRRKYFSTLLLKTRQGGRNCHGGR